jgi:hypothetical protein
MLIFTGCDMQNEEPVPVVTDASIEIGDTHAKKIEVPGGIIDLEGVVHFRLYLVKTNEWFMNATVPATATLEYVDGKNYILTMIEFIRNIPYQTTITPSGIVECIHPVPFDCYDPFDMTLFNNPIDQLEYTTGFALSGPGLNKGTLIYKGKFDGEDLTASTHFTGIQVAYGTAPIYQQDYEGPLQFEFAWELTVVDN